MNSILIILILIIILVIVFLAVHYFPKEVKTVSKNKNLYVGDYFYKIYPLCCDECKKHAKDILSRYEEAASQNLPVIRVIDHYVTNRKLVPDLKDSPHGYLVVKLEKFVPTHVEPKNLDSISAAVKYFRSKNIPLKDLSDSDLGIVNGKVVLINLD